ncbi:MAG TPA: TonB-dependent receptor [Thermoanaerobaculia bacterium]
MRGKQLWLTAIVGMCLLAMAGLAFGQAKSGNIYGRVVDDDGNALPGVTVTLSGVGATQVFVSDSRGDFRFLNLAPSPDYHLKFEIDNFATVERKGVSVNTGVNTDVRVGMKLAKVEASVTVSGEAPLLDTRRVGTGATITRQEMDAMPTARDPWVVVQTIPGVQIDRINVGGNQSGQQSLFVAKGSQINQGSWNLDGVTVSDAGSGNSSPTYWDFDAFQELQAVTGGSDPSIAAMGVTLNMVTKRGTNDIHGSARTFITAHQFEANVQFTGEMQRQRDAAAGVASFVGNRIQGIQDYGAEVGGPILRDRAWLWGSYARQQIDWVTSTGLSDKTTLEDINGKLNVQVLDSNALTVFFLRGDKIKFGREAGPQRPQPTSRDQNGPSHLYKVEDSHIFSANIFANAQYSYLDEFFQLIPEGGMNVQSYRGSDDVWQRSYVNSLNRRPQHQVLGNSSVFFNTGMLGHELKLGGMYRIASIGNAAQWPGGGVIGFAPNATGGCGAVQCAAITRQSNRKVAMEYVGLYLSDVMKADRLTFSVGARYDWQTGHVRASSVPASGLFPEILPAANAPAQNDVITWKNLSPRLGLTYAIGKERKTLARASYARYANNLWAYPNNQLAAIPGIAYLYYPWTDANSNRVVDPGEVNFTAYAKTPANFNPLRPSDPVSPNAVDPNLDAQTTDEFVVGVDHELFPNFAVGAAYTYRKYDNFYFSTRYSSSTGQFLTQADYVINHYVTGTLPDGTAYNYPVYNTTVRPVPTGAYFLNRPDYTQTFNGAELTLTKRLSNGWMARGSFAWNDAKQQVGSKGCFDRTNAFYTSGEDSVPGMCEDGGIVAPNAGGGSGAFGFVNLNSKWQANVNAMYQLPMGFGVAANYFIRQGYPIGYYVIDQSPTVANGGDALQRRVYVADIDKYRYASVSQFDMRLDKVIAITSSVSMTLAVDVFNVFNTATVLQRNSRLNQASRATGTGTIFEIQAPRVARFGARIAF